MRYALPYAVGLGSCTAPSIETEIDNGSDAESPAASDRPVVVTTFLPMTQFTKAVTGDRAEVVQLLPNNVGPHDYQAKPDDVEALATADVLVKNGLGAEEFLEDLIQNAGNATLITVDSSEGIPAFESAEDGHGEDTHEEDSHDEHADEHAHDGDAREAEKAHDHGGSAPHIWLDPKRAVEQVENIRDGLIEADPDGGAEYTSSAAAYIAKLDEALDQEITEQLTPYSGQTYISFHDFTAYFAESYGLKAEFLVAIPEVNPSPGDVRTVVETAQAKNVGALLSEPQAGEDAFAAIAKNLNVEVGIFDPMETGESAEPDAYLTTMRQNVDSLEAALNPWLDSMAGECGIFKKAWLFEFQS